MTLAGNPDTTQVEQEQRKQGSQVEPTVLGESPEGDASDLQQGVKEFGDAILDTVAESGIQERVDALGMTLEEVERYVSEWRNWKRGPDLEMFHTLKDEVEAVQSEWQNLTTSLQAQRDRLETLLRSFPGVVEVSSVKALALRVEQLERLMGQVMEERRSQSDARAARRQLIVSLVALGFTAVLWTVWIVLTLVN